MTQATATKHDSACCGGPAVPPLEHFFAMSTKELVARYRKGVENYDRRLFWLSESDIDQAFLPEAGVGQWPIRVLLGHLADAELAFVARMRKTVAEEHPVLQPWDEQAFIDANLYGHISSGARPTTPGDDADKARVAAVLGGFVAVVHTLRQWTGAWLETLTEEQFARKAMHPERGEQTVKIILAYDTWHLEHHARFLRLKVDRLTGESAIRKKAGEDAAGAGGSCGAGCGCVTK